jgi:RNA polymerase sigma-70 factor (ECF subfamily)
LRLSGSALDAEEIVQDALVRAHTALAGYDAERIRSLHLRPWLYQITLNLVRNRARKRGVATVPLEGEMDGPSREPLPESAAVSAELRQDLAALLLTLPEGYRAAVVLRHVEGLRYGEIAQALDQPLGTVKASVHRGLAQLRRRLSEREDEVRV